MRVNFKYGKADLLLNLPGDSTEYSSAFDKPAGGVSAMFNNAVGKQPGEDDLTSLLKRRKPGNVAIVVSDITRPIPYWQFLPGLLELIESNDVSREEIIVLVATGMHRPSTASERVAMFGKYVASNYRIVDHEADNAEMLVELPGTSKSGMKVNMNKYYVNAGFRIVTGLVEPHFMAGFSGGRKAICPGLVSLKAIEKFHGFEFLNSQYARNINLHKNPCHEESQSIAALAPPDFSINVILDNHKEINNFTAGELTRSHKKAIEIVRKACCPVVEEEADLVITSCGGHPLDATFYQCVKAMVTCLPAIRKRGKIIAFGSCSEGIGSSEYIKTMSDYSGRYREFLHDIQNLTVFKKDQWQFQMHCRTIEKVGVENLFFFTDGLDSDIVRKLAVNTLPHSKNEIAETIQEMINQAVTEGKKIAFIPEGPYCAPVGSCC